MFKGWGQGRGAVRASLSGASGSEPVLHRDPLAHCAAAAVPAAGRLDRPLPLRACPPALPRSHAGSSGGRSAGAGASRLGPQVIAASLVPFLSGICNAAQIQRSSFSWQTGLLQSRALSRAPPPLCSSPSQGASHCFGFLPLSAQCAPQRTIDSFLSVQIPDPHWLSCSCRPICLRPWYSGWVFLAARFLACVRAYVHMQLYCVVYCNAHAGGQADKPCTRG